MPYINVDEAYILDNTGLQVDQVVDLPYTDAGLTDTQKAQARKNIAAGGSNPNLLDNAYFVGGGSQLGDGVFPINQRGQSSYSGNASTNVDRWWQQYDATVTLISAGLRLTGKWNISQRLPRVLPNGTYTFSVDIVTLNSAGVTIFFIDQSDQIVAGATKVIDSTGITSLTITSDQIKGVAINLTNSSGTGDITIASAKLELGTVSTLANDPPPDFGEELRKCQQYLWVEKFPANTIIGSGITFNTNTIYDIVTPVAMRTGGTLTMTVSTSLYVVYNAVYALAGVVNGITSHGNHLRVSMNNNGGSDYGTLNHADLLVSYETVVTVANEL